MKLQYIIRFIFISILGVLLHFTYQWSDNNTIVGLFSAINESTFEHLKLIFFPILLLTIIEYIHKPCSISITSRFYGILVGISTIIICFYTFFGVTGKLIGFVNIAIYFLGVIFALYTEYMIANSNIKVKHISQTTSIIFIFIMVVLFFFLTYNAPNSGIFFDLSIHPQ